MRWKRPGSSIFTEDLAVSISYIKNFLDKNACPATVSDCEQNMRFLFYSQKFQVIKIFSSLCCDPLDRVCIPLFLRFWECPVVCAE